MTQTELNISNFLLEKQIIGKQFPNFLITMKEKTERDVTFTIEIYLYANYYVEILKTMAAAALIRGIHLLSEL